MVQLNENIVGIDAAIFMHPTTWKASGHVDAFNDPLIDNKDSKKRYRADVLIEDYVAKIENKINKEVNKAAKRFGSAFDKDQFCSTTPRVVEYRNKADNILKRMGQSLEKEDLTDVKALIEELEIACPESGSRNWTDVKQFNLMFDTKLGASADTAMDLYLRPETAQGIFVNFLNVQKSGRMKLPFGIAQIGKAFRNEIVARQFIFRMREFEQMEMQFFIPPGTQKEWYEHWKEKDSNGTKHWALVTKTIDFTTTKNSPIMPMQPPISNSNSPLDLKSWRASIPEPILIWVTTKNMQEKNYNISIQKETKTTYPMLLKPLSVWTECFWRSFLKPCKRKP